VKGGQGQGQREKGGVLGFFLGFFLIFMLHLEDDG